ncbi:Asp-tRNA(Asn)/Glu-tRNA(Gln) amidotransferase subunit GatA [bacterium]|nr:Asp-tRNA(Asn)/Glu-tRNA(Gln) amidotransferase subunit GatA [bacterium]
MSDGSVSSYEMVGHFIDAIERINPKINGYIAVKADYALARAKEIDSRRDSNEALGPLAGIPIAIKDNICTKGFETTCSSNILRSFVPPYNAYVVERFQDADAIILGKSNMDEFAMGSSTETSCFGPTVNPWLQDRVSGGSSGGAAAIVAADMASGALGSDTGGSIRQPAAFCGVVGMKPTYGRVSRFGLVAYASSLDQIGPVTKDVTDCALLLSVISGRDEKDSTSRDIEVPDYNKSLTCDIKGIRVGRPKEYFIGGLDSQVACHIDTVFGILGQAGADVEEVSLPHTDYAISAYYLIATAEASSNLARYDGVKYGIRDSQYRDLRSMYRSTRKKGFGSEVKRRIMLGTYALSSGYYDAYYLKAQKARTLIKRDFDIAFKDHDVLITPTTPTPAFKLGENISDPLQMYLNDIYTISANLAGVPAISIPCGFTKDGLPVGVQILGRPFEEGVVLKLAYALEQAMDLKRPLRFWEKGSPG